MKHIPTKILFALLFLSKITTGMDIMQTTKEPSISTKLAMEAINSDSPESLKLALSIGADISYLSELKTNLLLYATKTKKEKTALYLSTQEHFQNSAIINRQNVCGFTVLMCASCHGYKELTQNILKIKNINLDLQDYQSYSALHYAVETGQDDIITLLIEHGANPTLQNNIGITPAFFKPIFNSTTLSPSIIEKIMLAKDAQGNNQLHLLTTAQVGKMAKRAKTTTDILFSNLLENLIKHKISIWSTNNRGMLPLETAYEKYDQLYQQYKANKVSCLYNLLNHQEKILHLLLLYYLKNIQHKPILISSPFASELNIETVIAQKYKDHKDHAVYYQLYALDYKDKLKSELRDNLIRVPMIWIARQPLYSYIPPQLIKDVSSQTNNQCRKEKIS